MTIAVRRMSRRSHVGVALAVVAVLGGVACGQPARDEGLTASAVDEATRSVERFRFVSDMEYTGPVGTVEPEPGSGIVTDFEPAPPSRVEGQVDLAAGWMWAGVPGGAPAVVVDQSPPGALLRADLLPAGHRPPTAWVSFERPGAMLPHLPQELQGMLGMLGADSQGDPGAVTDMLKRYGATLERDGEEQVRGVETTRYDARFDTKRFRDVILSEFDQGMAQAPETADDPEFSRDDFRTSLATMKPPQMTVWVDDEGRLRRSESSPGVSDSDEEFGSFVMRAELFGFGEAMDIAHPVPADITPAAGLNLPEPEETEELEEPYDDADEDPEAVDDTPPGFPVPVRSRISFHPVESDEPGPCQTAAPPFYNGPGADDGERCYRLGAAALDRPMLTRAMVGGAGCDVEIGLAADDAARFETITAEALGRQLALVLDGEVLSAPTVNSIIEGGEVCISGGFDPGDAQEIVDRLTG